tara:strand:+ start:620 stop:805 length:186 start_codon:yes stop_codon:yes gene_type:complete
MEKQQTFEDYINELLPKAIEEKRNIDMEDGEEILTDKEYRLSVYEDLNDSLKYFFADVAYG